MKKTAKNDIERYFEWWVNDMIAYGYIKEVRREPETLVVHKSGKYGRIKRFKKKPYEVEQFNLFPEIRYTYDYIIVWDPSAEFLFYEEVLPNPVFQFGKPLFVAHRRMVNDDEEVVSYLDIKPTTSVVQRGGRVSSSVSFPFKKRLLWDHLRIYVNKVVPIPMAGAGYSSALFVLSFTPHRYLLTDGGKQKRKISFPITSLSGYVHKKRTELKEILESTK
jgi:hypothetical protein